MPEVSADMFDDMTYQDGMKTVSFVSDSQEAGLKMETSRNPAFGWDCGRRGTWLTDVRVDRMPSRVL